MVAGTNSTANSLTMSNSVLTANFGMAISSSAFLYGSTVTASNGISISGQTAANGTNLLTLGATSMLGQVNLGASNVSLTVVGYPLGHGGGLIRLVTPRLVVDGVIRADAPDLVGRGYNASGAGGGVRLDVGVLLGSGAINADGGDNQLVSGGDSYYMGGGGGRIAIYYGDKSGFTGLVSAKGGVGRDLNGTAYAYYSGGAGTVYWKQTNELGGELVVDNGGNDTVGWTTPLTGLGGLQLKSWTITGNARVSISNGVRVANGSASYFSGLISSNYLQVGSLVVSNTWVFGDVVDVSISQSNSVYLVAVICRPQKTYLLLATTNFVNWIPVTTNIPSGSRFDFVDTAASGYRQRFFRAVMLDLLYNSLGISINPTNRRAQLAVNGAQPPHTLVIQASDDLRTWTPIATNVPVAITNWQFIDINAPLFNKRFYRIIGQ